MVEDQNAEEWVEVDYSDEEDSYYFRLLPGIDREDTSTQDSITLGESFLVQSDLGSSSNHHSGSQ